MKTVLKLVTPQSSVSQQQPRSQKPGVKSQRQASGMTSGGTVVRAGVAVSTVGVSDTVCIVVSVGSTVTSSVVPVPPLVDSADGVAVPGVGVGELKGCPGAGLEKPEEVTPESVTASAKCPQRSMKSRSKQHQRR